MSAGLGLYNKKVHHRRLVDIYTKLIDDDFPCYYFNSNVSALASSVDSALCKLKL